MARRSSSRLSALDRRHRDAGDRRAAHARGARAGGAAVRAARRPACARWSAGEHDPGLILDAYLLRSLAIAGWSPTFDDCARCGAPGPHRAFSIPTGGVVCPQCRPPGSAAPSPLTISLLGALLSGDWPHRRREPAPRPARGAAASSRPSWPGTWKGACGRCRWSIARAADRTANRGARCQDGRMARRTVAQPRRSPTPHRSGARPPALPAEFVPRHVALVMDGNGRWAKERGPAADRWSRGRRGEPVRLRRGRHRARRSAG